MIELADLRRAVVERDDAIARAHHAYYDVVLEVYRARREDGEPKFTLAEIGDVLGVSRQRAFQIVRRAAQELGSRTESSA